MHPRNRVRRRTHRNQSRAVWPVFALASLAVVGCVRSEEARVACTASPVLNGDSGPSDHARFVVRINHTEGFCTGFLVSSHTVLTARHCASAEGAVSVESGL